MSSQEGMFDRDRGLAMIYTVTPTFADDDDGFDLPTAHFVDRAEAQLMADWLNARAARLGFAPVGPRPFAQVTEDNVFPRGEAIPDQVVDEIAYLFDSYAKSVRRGARSTF